MNARGGVEALLIAAVRAAPRRHRLPPLPADVGSADSPETVLAVAIEAARVARTEGRVPPEALGASFVRALADVVARAVRDPGGDPAFQALVLHADDAAVAEHVRLAQDAQADTRAVRGPVDAIAHPGKLRAADPAQRQALEPLHQLARAGRWGALRQAAQDAIARGLPSPAAQALAQVLAHPALARLERAESLAAQSQVRHYLALRAGGAQAGSDAAFARGRAAQQLGALAEEETAQAFATIAQWLDDSTGEPGRHHAVGALRPPPGFPGEAGRAKDEWDAALLRRHADGTADVLLLAETKASPAAASGDWPRLLRGLRRLARAQGGAAYPFRTDRAEWPLRGTSLQALLPQDDALPAHVLYCCSAPPEPAPSLLAPAARALLLQEEASVACGVALARGAQPMPDALLPVWQALAAGPRLQSVLQQDAATRAAREAMVHPQDLLAAVADALKAGR